MGKRNSAVDDGAAAYRKRQKISHEVPTSEDVTSSDQLLELLSFDQDMRRARHGTLSPVSLTPDQGLVLIFAISRSSILQESS